jgi:drug/metabolite transporter (DMT)-like permease
MQLPPPALSSMEISLPVTLAVLAGALLHAGWNTMLKSSADKQLDTVAISVGAGLAGLVVAPFLQLPSVESLPWLAASTLVHILYFVLLAGAYRWGDLSFAYPIMRGGGPVIVALAGATAFGEVLSWAQTAGVAFICAGIVSFATVRTNDASAFRKALAFALGNAAVIAAYTLIDAKGARASGSPVAYTLWFFAANGAALYLYGGLRRGTEVPRYLAANWKRMAVGAVCTTGSYAIALWATTQAPVAIVACLRETSVIFVALIGALFLRERFTGRRIFATFCVIAGLVSLRF